MQFVASLKSAVGERLVCITGHNLLLLACFKIILISYHASGNRSIISEKSERMRINKPVHHQSA
jgi:hypothetical protein